MLRCWRLDVVFFPQHLLLRRPPSPMLYPAMELLALELRVENYGVQRDNMVSLPPYPISNCLAHLSRGFNPSVFLCIWLLHFIFRRESLEGKWGLFITCPIAFGGQPPCPHLPVGLLAYRPHDSKEQRIRSPASLKVKLTDPERSTQVSV